MDKKIIKIERHTGEVLFEYAKENNTIKDTLLEALKQGASLYGADLHGADLHGADLRHVNLRCVDLHDANLRDVNLYNADLCYANICYADLRCANLYYADLCYTNLYNADLRGANLRGADLRGAKNVPYFPLVCPTDGEFIGWKKVGDKWLVKLRIPEDAKRSSATTQKCRCDKAEVLAITDLEGNNTVKEIINNKYVETLYKVGEMVYPDKFDKDRWNECSHGIHFFINKQDAIDYQ